MVNIKRKQVDSPHLSMSRFSHLFEFSHGKTEYNLTVSVALRWDFPSAASARVARCQKLSLSLIISSHKEVIIFSSSLADH